MENVIRVNLVSLRKAHNLTQKEIGNTLGVSYQTISKWENGNSLPDIMLLPKLAEIFKISTDQLLGVLPIDYSNYKIRNKDSEDYRNKVIDQFIATRLLYWNDDYLSFIIKDVWKINEPVHIAEIGCGNGMFAEQVLSFLPKGSKYTGFEKSLVMREQETEFVRENINAELLPFEKAKQMENRFDLVICQGYLRHLNKPSDGIELMISLLKTGGLLVCHEEYRPYENTSLLLGQEKDLTFEKGVLLEKIWKSEYEKEGRDYRIGLKLPFLLKENKLTNIKCRLNDHVDMILGDAEDEETLMLLNKHYELSSITENEFLSFLLERGLNRYESLRYLELYKHRKSFMEQKYEEIEMIHHMGLVLSWGRK